VSGLFDLAGRVCVVTGALGRLGPIWIEALLSAGATVAGIDRPGASSSGHFEELQARYGQRLGLYFADVRVREQLVAARERCLADLGTPSVLVNNAGIDQPPNTDRPQFRLAEIPGQVFRDVLDVNIFGTFQVVQVIAEPMLAAGRGSIINIGSLYATVAPDARLYDHLPFDPPFLKPPAYGASKAAVVNLTRYLAALWGAMGIRVNALSPGGVLGEQDDTFIRKFSSRVPLGRMAVPSDLVGPLLFLASDASAYVTGIDLKVDGGFTVW
jgi:NAD(P)-dependent dehydrogenase (short-subunit alcohol dehydrogenase family)